MALFTRGDFAGAFSFFVLAILLRVPFRSHYAYHWDSAQFALAVEQYNIHIGQPQAPGFYLYVALGRLANLFVGDPHAALVWLSVLAGAWLVAVGYLLATSMFGRKCGVGTGLILLTSPLCWFHSEIALTTIVDSALVVSFVFVCWRSIQGGVTWGRTVALAVLLAAVAGVRQQSAPVLIPLWFYVFWGFARPRGRKLLCATTLSAAVSLFWFAPTVNSAGGLAAYAHLLRLKSQFDAPRTVWGGGGLRALQGDLFCMGAACWAGLLVAAIVAATEFILWVFPQKWTAKSDFYRTNKVQLCVLVLWLAPIVAFDLSMYVAMPGHVLNFFPGVAILAGLGLSTASERMAVSSAGNRAWALVCVWAVIAAVNVIVFVGSPRWTRHVLMGMNLTGAEIGDHDADLSACFRKIRQNWSPKNVVICHRREEFYWGFRQFEYHLPEYRNVLLSTDASLPGILGTQQWVGHEYRTTFQDEIKIPEGQDVILVVPPGASLDFFKSRFDLRGATLVMESRIRLYVLHP